ncbi:5366_t:CDS:2 [Funneliformis geosporum]|uniref:DNA ligase n=1 Tax=Funneliformis geosporum TaxID=1117311 RepID=A0A9W4SAE4_9GLOM|nr:2834_t:CDS:2 [Funneliformis geosporum]CAI2178988.1 5366_t:CDS:2 [Funneliformis geosporum]
MKRKSTIKKAPTKKKVKEDKSQRNLEFYFNKQSKPTNETGSKKPEENSNKEENIKQIDTIDLTNSASEENSESNADNANDKELRVTVEQPEAVINLDTSDQSGTVFEKPASSITSIFNDSNIQSSKVTLNNNDESSSSSSKMSVDMDVLEFDPSKINWIGLKAPYSFLSDTFVIVEKTTSRLKIINCLTNMFRAIIYNDPDSVLPAVWLSSNAIAPSYEGIEIGIGSQILTKAVTSISGTTSKALKKYYDRYGDWGDVTYAAKVSIRTIVEHKPLTIEKVYKTLISISKLKGTGVIDQKADLVKKLLISCKGEEIRYLTRTLIQNLRIGAVRTTCLIALSHAFCLTRSTNMVISDSIDDKNRLFIENIKKEPRDSLNAKLKAAEKLLKEYYAQFPNYNGIVKFLLENPIEKLLDISYLTVGVPLKPMLGKITRDLGQIFKNLEGRSFNCEYKYDGQRAQIHMDADGKVSIFSRNLENMTDRFPDIVEMVPQFCMNNVESFILDCEVVAVELDGKIRNFQALTNRSRKNVELSSISIPIRILAFDLMYLNGESLLKKPLRERRDFLRTKFTEIPNRFTYVNHIESSDPEEIHSFFKESMEFGCEGIMVKVLDDPPKSLKSKTRMNLLSSYEPDKRIESWLKVKKDYVDGIGDSLDVVPIGAWYGNGRKAGWWSPILFAIYNPDRETFESVCKCMSGFSDDFYKELRLKYSEENGNISEYKKSYFDVDDGLRPDVWFEPSEVWEIKGADITISPVYKAAIGKVDQNKGLSLRFPRFVRVREDKGIEEATTSAQLAELFYNQVNERKEEIIEEEIDEEDAI